MAHKTRKVEHFVVMANRTRKPGRPGALETLRQAGVTLLAFSGIPVGGHVQLDFVPEDSAAFRAAARAARWPVSGPKAGFLVSGNSHPGAVAEVLGTLADAKIKVTSVGAVAAGAGQFSAILGVSPAHVGRAAKLLGAS
jgi:hypothetical protein